MSQNIESLQKEDRIFRPAEATFYMRYSNTQGFADQTVVFGNSSWLAVAGSFGLG